VVPEDFKDLTPAQLQQAHVAMKDVLHEAIEHTLSELKLVP